ncbi:MAG: phosphoenolpyruvate synthase, partial [Bacteroidales bacterium]|nr:phosphoenolpyruvate synthase [Bacteroidales bacterium]
LIGPGRWGSSDPNLGISVKWYQISNAKVIIESGLDNYRIEPSQGTHFFHNLTAMEVAYFTINPYINEGIYDIGFLMSSKVEYEDEFVRHVSFNNEIRIEVNGRLNKGIIYKP